ncbi:MAG: hypothetical protein HQK89_05210 [Nitrospirae bacterium]|nr:hypothetical protein [Nitrospirota bacterium]
MKKSASQKYCNNTGGGFKIAGDLDPSHDLTAVGGVSAFARSIGSLFEEIRPKRLIETGTYLGMGTTAIIASALKELVRAGHVADPIFYSIEVNPQNYERARENLKASGLIDYVKPLLGLSVPRDILPSIEEIERLFVKNICDSGDGVPEICENNEPGHKDIAHNDIGHKDIAHAGIFVDHREDERASLYYGETNFPDTGDDLLGKCLADFDYRPDFVLLDSAGHLGYVEFTYLVSRLRGDCYVALDDVYHVKHYGSLIKLKQDGRFTILVESREKFGFCIARFSPGFSS